MAHPETLALERAARRAYELGRLRGSLGGALLAGPAAVIGLRLGTDPVLAALQGGLLFLLALAFGWRGGEYGRAVRPGLAAGSVPLVLPLLARGFGSVCVGDRCVSICLVCCVIGGLTSGGLLGLRAGRARDPGRSLLAAAAIAGLAGSLGCACSGVFGVTGMLAGFAVAALPALAVTRLARA